MLTEWLRGPAVSSGSRRADVRRLGPLVVVLALTVGVAAEEPRLAVSRAGSSLTVAFDLRPERMDDLATRLRAGAPVSVTWQIDIRREVGLWVDRDVKRHAVTVTARRTAEGDSFVIERSLNRRTLGTPRLATLDETYRHLTSFGDLELPYSTPVASTAPLRVAIKARVDGGGEARIVTPELARTVIER